MIQIDMGMPKSCIVCPFIGHYPNDKDIPICYPIGKPLDDTRVNFRPNWCPIKEVKTGKWIFQRNYTWACSECGTNPTDGMGYVQRKEELFKYCPNCGARMDG